MQATHENRHHDRTLERRERVRRASDIGRRHCTCACTCGAEGRCASPDCDNQVEPGRRYCIWHPTLELARPFGR